MADLRESFPTLQDATTQEGKSLIARQEGDAAAAQNGSIGFAYKDSSGNVILPQLDASGNVPVIIDHLDQEGDAAAGKEGLVAFAFKDSTGDLVLPQLTVGGQIQVAVTEGLCYKSPAGELAAGSATLVIVTGAEITLSTSTTYAGIGFVLSSRRDSLFQIIQQDDATDTILAEFIVGPGQYTVNGELHCLKITTGGSGTQKLKVKAKNFEALSSLRATITCQAV
jgi:hypothetical protein